MELLRFTFNPFGVNTYIVYDRITKECAVIDPGMVNDEEFSEIVTVMEKYGLKPVHLINTHLHVDHVLGNHFIREKYQLRLKANQKDALLGRSLSEQKRTFGMRDDGASEIIEEYLDDGDIVRIGEGSLKVLAVPGHSPGGISLYDEEGKFVITGDSLFQGSVGRTDLPGGDMPTLLNSISQKLLSLPDDTKVNPGHGPATSIGMERYHNPFLRDNY